MRQRPGINENNIVPPLLKFDCRGDAVNPGANNDDSRHVTTAHVLAALVSSAEYSVGRVTPCAPSFADRAAACRGLPALPLAPALQARRPPLRRHSQRALPFE